MTRKLLKLVALLVVFFAVMSAAAWYWLPMTPAGTRVVITQERIGMFHYSSITLFGSGLVAVRLGGGDEPIWLRAARSRYFWVPAGDVDRLISALDATRYFDLRTEYKRTNVIVKDTGFVTVCVDIGDRHMCVEHEFGAPPAPESLSDLEDLIWSVTDVTR